MKPPPRKPLRDLVAETCALIDDPSVPDAVADEEFATVNARLTSLASRAVHARTDRPELELLRAQLLPTLFALHERLGAAQDARSVRRYPPEPDGAPSLALEREVAIALSHDSDEPTEPLPDAAHIRAALGRWIGALRHKTVTMRGPDWELRGTLGLPPDRVAFLQRIYDNLAAFDRISRALGDMALFGAPQNEDDESELELLIYFACDLPEEDEAPRERPN